MSLHPRLDDLLELRHQARTLGLASHHLVNSALTGLYASVFRGHGLDFDEVREYREGDDIRNMEWHITARTGVPHLKVFREERERTVMLCVDQGPHMNFGTRGTFKSIQAARAAALLGWSASIHQDRVGAVLFGDPRSGMRYFRSGRGRRALWRTLRALTDETAPGPLDGQPLLDALTRLTRGVPTGTLIFVIGALDAEIESMELRLGGLRQRHEVVLLPVDDPADWDIPAMGRVIFTAPDGRALELDTDNVSGRQQYRERWEQRRKQFTQMVHRLGIAVIPLRTNEDVHQTLLEGLQRRARSRALRM